MTILTIAKQCKRKQILRSVYYSIFALLVYWSDYSSLYLPLSSWLTVWFCCDCIVSIVKFLPFDWTLLRMCWQFINFVELISKSRAAQYLCSYRFIPIFSSCTTALDFSKKILSFIFCYFDNAFGSNPSYLLTWQTLTYSMYYHHILHMTNTFVSFGSFFKKLSKLDTLTYIHTYYIHTYNIDVTKYLRSNSMHLQCIWFGKYHLHSLLWIPGMLNLKKINLHTFKYYS